jgi:hypothetical protein
MIDCGCSCSCSCRRESAPECFGHPVARVLAEGCRYLGVALGLAQLGNARGFS